MEAAPTRSTEQLIVRVAAEVHSALQLAQPFAQRRSMQDLLGAIIDDFLNGLRASDPGFEKALIGLRESQARRQGVLAHRTTPGNSSAS
jgi:hypothetical protein